MRLGFALMKDRRVPVVTKFVALGVGLGLTFVLEALELPVEGILAALVPFLGVGLDVVIDGAETVILPFVFGAILLTHFAPKSVVNRIRVERGSLILQPSI